MLSLDLFGRPYDQLNDSEQEILMEYFSKSKDTPERTMAAGGGIMNPNDIRAIRISCQACPSSTGNPICPENFGKDVRTDIDHIIFTANSSLLDQ